jgi:hypothetical protein
MERTAPVRSSYTSTSDLLAWPQNQGPATPSPARRPGQVRLPIHSSLPLLLHPVAKPRSRAAVGGDQEGGVRGAGHRGGGRQPQQEVRGRFRRVLVLSPQIWTGRSTDLTSACLSRKQCSAPKWKEMTGSGIFAAGSNGDFGEDGSSAAKPARSAPRNHQVMNVWIVA